MSQLLEAFQFIYYTTFERLTFCRGNKIEKFVQKRRRVCGNSEKKSVTDENNDEIKYNYAKKSRVASDTCLEDSNKYLSPRQTIFFIFKSDYLYSARVHFLDRGMRSRGFIYLIRVFSQTR